jgi:hypothetical protein
VEIWEEEKGWKPFLPPKLISTGFKGKWRKQIARSRLQQNKDKLCQRIKGSIQEHPERTNPASIPWEFHRDVTRHGQPKCRRDTQEIPRGQK